MRNSFNFILLMCISLLPSLVSAQNISKDFDTFYGISASGNIDLELVSDSRNYAEISGKQKDIDKLKIDMKGNTLRFKIKNGGLFNWFNRSGNIKITLHYKEKLDNIRSSAGADISSNEVINSDNLELSSSSGASLDLDIDCKTLDASVSSGADINLTGSADIQEVSTSSGASYNAKKLGSSETVAKASSGSDIIVWVSQLLEAKASSGASVRFLGDPSKDLSTSSGGSIKSIDSSKT